jgi:AraC-like DNA-binding protein
MHMKCFARLSEFKNAKAPRALVGEGWLHFQAHEKLFGIVLWGRPTSDGIRALVHSLKLELPQSVTPHASLVDASRMDGVDGGAFEALSQYVRDFEKELSRAVIRLALVRPPGLAGAVTSGFFEVSGTPYPVAVFESAPGALEWLDEDPKVGAMLDQALEEITGKSELLARLHALLRTQLAETSLAQAASGLAMSERTLQRRLKNEGTSFAQEVLGVRLGEAKRRMRDSDESLSTIATECGFSSQQHLSTAFKKDTGKSPSAWRNELKKP